jgi:hypothetical protein
MHPLDEYDCITPLYSFVDELISYSLMSARASVAGLLPPQLAASYSMSAIGTSRRFAALRNLSAIGA